MSIMSKDDEAADAPDMRAVRTLLQAAAVTAARRRIDQKLRRITYSKSLP